jgi:hypothetical protein
MMTRVQELREKAELFTTRAAHAKVRTERNTYLSLAQSCRSLAEIEESLRSASDDGDRI